MKKTGLFITTLLFFCEIAAAQVTTITGGMTVNAALGGLACDGNPGNGINCREDLLWTTWAPYTFCSTYAAAGGATSQPCWTSFDIPAGCTVVVNAEYGETYRVFGQCDDSRMDGSGSDLLGIANTAVTNAQISATSAVNVGTCGYNAAFSGGTGSVGVVAGGCQASANTDETVTYSDVGPVTVTVWGRPNRSDEIVTFTVTGTGASCANIGVIVLPVEIIGYGATRIASDTISVNWSTATETNNSYFMVQYSLDGTNFINYKEIKGAGNSTTRKDYKCPFTVDVENNTVYFRLQQVDYNDNFKYSPVFEIGSIVGYTQQNASAINVYFNRDNSTITTKFKLEAAVQVNFTLYDIAGQEVYTSTNQFNEGDNQFLIPAPDVSGVYILVYQNGSSVPVRKKVMVTK